MNTVNVSEFRNNIADFINRIIYKNESFFIKKGNVLVAKVCAIDNKGALLKKKNPPIKFSGILNDEEAGEIKKNMKKFRQDFRLIP